MQKAAASSGDTDTIRDDNQPRAQGKERLRDDYQRSMEDDLWLAEDDL